MCSWITPGWLAVDLIIIGVTVLGTCALKWAYDDLTNHTFGAKPENNVGPRDVDWRGL